MSGLRDIILLLDEHPTTVSAYEALQELRSTRSATIRAASTMANKLVESVEKVRLGVEDGACPDLSIGDIAMMRAALDRVEAMTRNEQ